MSTELEPAGPAKQPIDPQLVFILGLVGIVAFPAAFAAAYMGWVYKKQCDEAGEQMDSNAQVGWILSLIFSAMYLMLILFFILHFVFIIVFVLFYFVMIFFFLCLGVLGAASGR